MLHVRSPAVIPIVTVESVNSTVEDVHKVILNDWVVITRLGLTMPTRLYWRAKSFEEPTGKALLIVKVLPEVLRVMVVVEPSAIPPVTPSNPASV